MLEETCEVIVMRLTDFVTMEEKQKAGPQEGRWRVGAGVNDLCCLESALGPSPHNENSSVALPTSCPAPLS